MVHRIVFRPAARADLKALYDYIAKQTDHRLAGEYLDRLEASCQALTVFPERGTVRNDLLPGIRIIGFERRVSIAFMAEADTVRILRVLYGGQSFPEDWSPD
ncbi:type II toxin-antitoxin system RelE/ParE family toxin [Rhizobium mayense]|uniref:Type II toxin-antitoxin system RelE/ParE family toxin n=1 Tax=Rhizobium mayense TaxID=1312184 RepID=A0ABT7JZY0_9HYPH|nr:type II toxin-antitoxin system RelE/ParE family toxin [Rhizobium mayense]MDL2400748.1 type II toxin-antitoxin system RelE/ParE family toxin [Rhizobium mayense]